MATLNNIDKIILLFSDEGWHVVRDVFLNSINSKNNTEAFKMFKEYIKYYHAKKFDVYTSTPMVVDKIKENIQNLKNLFSKEQLRDRLREFMKCKNQKVALQATNLAIKLPWLFT